ncbi:hypothetical protein AFK68_09110 [Hydrocoleum sp. CS-953]|uniref:hypothetical protein n=1 Tax=Hydrocoleum sp. CS-953 TaxID=1671698 RepID=UPI000B9C5E3D|nr:hypothetical protein [Hydrocoleum sp. CS-953]OZH54730.1 hypothetical protein AFK68_09110 [Hydrocoleum sp. CS-953]
MAKSLREARGEGSTSKNIYLLLGKADIWKKSLTNLQLLIYITISIYRSRIFTSEENGKKLREDKRQLLNFRKYLLTSS